MQLEESQRLEETVSDSTVEKWWLGHALFLGLRTNEHRPLMQLPRDSYIT